MKLDNKVTESIQEWLETPVHNRDIMKGATLMLSLNRNRALYNTVIRRPEKYMDKVEYELRKFLKMRLDNMSVADVVRMEAKVMPAAQETIDNAMVLSTEDELPSAAVVKGKRPDHDALPAAVQKLWSDNAERIRKIAVVFNELKAMHDAQPCDRYEKLVILDDLDKAYRNAMMRYDSYINSETSALMSADNAGLDPEKAINAARKTISKYRKQIAEMGPEDPRRTVALDKIQNSVNILMSLGANVAQETREELVALGIKFE